MLSLYNTCHVYAVTTQEGIKEICNNDIFGAHVDKANIMHVGSTECEPHEALFYFETFGVRTDAAYELLAELKKYRHYECVFIPALETMPIKMFASSDDLTHLEIRRTVHAYDDDENDAEPLDPADLDDLGIPQTRAPVPSMFKFTQVGDNNVQIENAEVVEIHHHK